MSKTPKASAMRNKLNASTVEASNNVGNMVKNLDNISDGSRGDTASMTSAQLLDKATKHISFLSEVNTANQSSNT